MQRRRPNILITGTPGTGKTTTAELVALAAVLDYIEVGKIIKETGLHEGFDDEFQSYVWTKTAYELKVIDALERMMQDGGKVLDHHGCDFFPAVVRFGRRTANG